MPLTRVNSLKETPLHRSWPYATPRPPVATGEKGFLWLTFEGKPLNTLLEEASEVWVLALQSPRALEHGVTLASCAGDAP